MNRPQACPPALRAVLDRQRGEQSRITYDCEPPGSDSGADLVSSSGVLSFVRAPHQAC